MYRIFFFNDTATTEIYTLSLHDALPISSSRSAELKPRRGRRSPSDNEMPKWMTGSSSASNIRYLRRDRKSTRLNSSHQIISYAVFCLKKKKNKLPVHSS